MNIKLLKVTRDLKYKPKEDYDRSEFCEGWNPGYKDGVLGYFISIKQTEQVVKALKSAVQLICGEFCSDVNRHSWHSEEDKALEIFLGGEK